MKKATVYILKGIIILLILIFLIYGYKCIINGTDNSLVMLFPILIYIITMLIALFSPNFSKNYKFKGKERKLYVIVGISYIVIFGTILNLIINNVTYEYKHTTPFLWFSVDDSVVVDLYCKLFSSFFLLIMVLVELYINNKLLKHKKKKTINS